MNRHILTLATAVIAATALSSCHHKDLIYESELRRETEIRFDWSNAPDAAPASMSAFLFRPSGRMIRFDFTDREGGEADLPVGTYSGIALNSDNTDWALLRNTESVDDFEIATRDVTSLTGMEIGTRALPRAAGTEIEPIVATPGSLWSARSDNMEVTEKAGKTVLTFYPEEVVCHYTVDIYGVTNISGLTGSAVDATLSGMSGGYLHGKGTPSDSRVTMPIKLIADLSDKALHAEFLTFGENPYTDYEHKLTVYIILSDGSKRYYVYDVTGQVRNAADPRHVHITVRGLELPEATADGGGFVPEVNDWESENVDLQM